MSVQSVKLFRVAAGLILAGLLTAPGCAWRDSLKGEGFPGWSEALGGSVRGKDQNAQPSGFFTDKRSEQIEQNLGGGF